MKFIYFLPTPRAIGVSGMGKKTLKNQIRFWTDKVHHKGKFTGIVNSYSWTAMTNINLNKYANFTLNPINCG